jgi:hypothetical protein
MKDQHYKYACYVLSFIFVSYGTYRAYHGLTNFFKTRKTLDISSSERTASIGVRG